MRGSKKLVHYMCKFKGIDTSLFEHEVEWELADKLCLLLVTEEQLADLEALAAKI